MHVLVTSALIRAIIHKISPKCKVTPAQRAQRIRLNYDDDWQKCKKKNTIQPKQFIFSVENHFCMHAHVCGTSVNQLALSAGDKLKPC